MKHGKEKNNLIYGGNEVKDTSEKRNTIYTDLRGFQNSVSFRVKADNSIENKFFKRQNLKPNTNFMILT